MAIYLSLKRKGIFHTMINVALTLPKRNEHKIPKANKKRKLIWYKCLSIFFENEKGMNTKNFQMMAEVQQLRNEWKAEIKLRVSCWR